MPSKTEYRIFTKKQVKFLSKFFEALGITLDELMLIKNLPLILEKFRQLEEAFQTTNDTLNSNNNIVIEYTRNVQKMIMEMQGDNFGMGALDNED